MILALVHRIPGEFSRHATRYSVNLNECVSRNEVFLLRGSAAVVRSGTIDFTKMADKVGAPDGRLWQDQYGNRVKSFLSCYVSL